MYSLIIATYYLKGGQSVMNISRFLSIFFKADVFHFSTGYYMYVAPYSGSITWASLTGPMLHNTATGCEMQFWALISGVNVGFIEVTILDDYNSWSGLTMDTPTGDNVWEQQIVRIGRNRGSLQVCVPFGE